MPEPTSFKHCLRLCAPALMLGLFLRLLVLSSTPEAMLTADTNSYWDCVSRLWNDGRFNIPEKRRWLYPLALMAAPALPGNTAQAIALAQHALGLCAIVGVGWIAAQLAAARGRAAVVPLVTLLFAASPRALAYEHQIIADSAMTNLFIVASAVALPLRGITQRRLAWTLALCAAVVALKPHGKPLALPILAAAAICAGRPVRRRWGNWALLALCGVLFVKAGSSRQGGWLLLSSTLPFVPEHGAPFSEYRDALDPVIREARAFGDAYPWEQFRYKKLLSDSTSYDAIAAGRSFAEAAPEWNELTRRKEEFGRVCSALARSGLRAEPLGWARFTCIKIARGCADSERALLAELSPAGFWEAQRGRNDERWAERPKAIALMYEMNRAEFDAFVQARRTRTDLEWMTRAIGPISRGLVWFRDDRENRQVHWTWFGVLGIAGIAASLRRRTVIDAVPLLAALALSLGSSFGIGDAIPRYVYPVEWMLFTFPILAVGAIGAALVARWKRNDE
jgi:hypothetical protein